MTTNERTVETLSGRGRGLSLPRVSRGAGLLLGLAILVLVAFLSLRIGSISISTSTVWNALFNYDASSYNETVVRSLRLPRTVIAMSVGAALAVSGGVMQGATRNQLADPFILGVSGGASFAIVTGVYFLGLSDPSQYVWLAFAGGLAASVLVYAVGAAGRGGATPIKLALAGAVVSALLGSWVTTLLLLDQQTLEVVRFWLAGSVAGRDLDTFWMVAPFLGLGLAVCLLMSHQLNVLSLGDDTARALGMNTGRVRGACSIVVVILTGASVAVAGPIGFVGLAVPHMVRSLVGQDYRWVLPYSVVGGAIMLTGADIIGRIVVRPSELQAGIITAIVGAPFLVVLARRRGLSDL